MVMRGSANFEVIEAEDAEAAVRSSEPRGAHPCAVQRYPYARHHGRPLALAHHTAKNWPKIALLLTSGRPRPRQRSLPERSRFLAKPCRHDHVFRHIRELAEAA